MKPVIKLLDVLRTYSQGAGAVTEASLSRVLGLANLAQQGGGSFAILTSWRKGNTNEQNEAGFKSLQATLRSENLGFRKLLGHWRECQDPNMPYKDCPPNQMVDTVEPSLFVWGISAQLAESLSKRYQQDAWIYAGPETQSKVALFFREGGHDVLGEWSPSTISQAYSQLYRRKKGKIFKNLEISNMGPGFTFAMPQAQPQAGVGNWAMAAESLTPNSPATEQFQFIELTPDNNAEAVLFSSYTNDRDTLLTRLKLPR